MCDPISLSIGLTAAGSVTQAIGQQKAQKAMAGAREAERIRQKGYQDESAAALAESQANADKGTQDAKQAKAEGDRKSAYESATAAAQAPVVAAGANLAGDQTANSVVDAEAAKATNRAMGYAGQQGNAKAALMGFNDVQLGNALFNARKLQEQARIANAMQGSSNVLGLEMEAASHKGDGLKTLGSLLAAGGAVTGLGAGAGWWGAKDAAAAAPTMANSITPSVVLPDTTGVPTFGIDPNFYTFGNTANPLFKTGVQAPIFKF